jgi:hypothetical protein
VKQHPFEPFPGTDAEMFIQWKGTSVCLDFYCPCGAHGHYDGDFAYNLRCPACGAVFELGTQVRAVRLADDAVDEALVRDLEVSPAG